MNRSVATLMCVSNDDIVLMRVIERRQLSGTTGTVPSDNDVRWYLLLRLV